MISSQLPSAITLRVRHLTVIVLLVLAAFVIGLLTRQLTTSRDRTSAHSAAALPFLPLGAPLVWHALQAELGP